MLRDLELTVLRSAREHAPQQLHLLRTVPGIGKILALNILYEVGEIHRFERVADFVSYCRLIRPDHTSAGKHVGFGPKKIGNTHLRWSFGEAAAGFPRKNPTGQRVVERLKRKYNKNAMNVLAHKLGRAVYFTAETQRGIRHQQTDELTDGGPPASPTPNWLLRVQPSAAAFFVASTTTRPHMAPGPSLSSLEWTPAVAPLFDNRRSRNA